MHHTIPDYSWIECIDIGEHTNLAHKMIYGNAYVFECGMICNGSSEHGERTSAV